MKRKINFLLVLLLLGVGLVSAQQNLSVSGVVTDASDGSPMVGVSIIVKGTTTATITDINGRYNLNVPQGSSLVFSYIGMEKTTIAVKGRVVNVALKSDSKVLDEVVAVGYGNMKKSDVSGSIVSVNAEEMMRKSPTNILQGLQGAAAGVIVTAQDGAPDANAAIRIRGVGTITGKADPLYVVDGVVVGTNANFLNPNDVASMEVLKDASATAIYGSAGANGVILITTKHGTAGSTHITFSADYGIQTLSSTLDVNGVDQFAQNIRTARANDGATIQNQLFAATYDGKRKNIDWQKEMTRVSLKQQYNLSASGGTEKTQSNFSLSYLNNDGIVINSNFNRLTARANVINKVNKFIEVGGELNFVHSQTRGSNASIGNNGNLSSLRDMAFMCPTMDYVDPVTGTYVSPNVKNANGTYGVPLQTSLGQYDGGISNNIYAEQMENNGLSKNNQLLLSTYANIKLYKGLTFKTVASYNYVTGSWQNFYGNKQRFMPDGVTQVVLTGYDTRQHLELSQNQGNYLALESYLTYNWKNDIHNLTLMAGNSVSTSSGTHVNASSYDFPSSDIRDISLTNDIKSIGGGGAYDLSSRGISYFGRLNYSLMDRYILTSTIRRDGSSNFGSGNRYGNFPSAALAWRISEEDFMKQIPTISNLKLRLGWGQTGNSGMNGNSAIEALTSNTIAYYYYTQGGIGGGSASGATTANGMVKLLIDPNLKWETNTQTNIGLDLGVLNNTLNFTFDYFNRTSKDLLLSQTIRPSAGYGSVYTNYGDIQNTGFEFGVNYKKQLDKDWNIGVNLTGSTLKNKVIKMGLDLLSVNDGSTNDGSNVGAVAASSGVHWDGHSICREGYAVGSFYGYQVEGIFQSQAEVDAANAAAKAKGHDQYQEAKTSVGDFKYKDVNGDGFIDSNDMTILGNGFPKVNYGLNLNASYKNWDFSVYSYGVLGQQIYSYSAMTLSNMYSTDNGTIPNLLKSASNEAWTPSNQSTTNSKLSLMDYNKNMRGSSAWVKNGDFLKISNIQVGYNFDRKLLKSLLVESARIYVAVQNVVCISSYNKYGDPEAGQGSVLFTGLDTGRYPSPRIYSVGLNVQF